MATDYTDKVLDLLAAFGADGFRYYTFASGGFQRTRTHDVGSTGWPWEFLHTWAVPAVPATRDALVRQGWIEPLPSALTMGNEYRVTSKALALLASEATSTWKLTRAPWQAYAVACAAAEADKKAHPNARQRV
jgi:hypothetical protein